MAMTPPASACASTGVPPAATRAPDAAAALDALGLAALLLDTARGTVLWRTGAWAARHAGWPDAALQSALHAARQAPGAAGRGSFAAPDGSRLEFVLLEAGLLVHAPGPAPESARALQRHLQDREKLLFTSRSISVGEMASTLAHEINQPIGTIANVLRGVGARVARLSVPAHEQPLLDELRQGLKLALDQAQFAGRIVGRIRDYTPARLPRHERLDLRTLAAECVALLDWEFARHGVPVHTEMAQPAWVEGDALMLQQVVVNLLRNALEAQREAPGPAARVLLRLRAVPGVAGSSAPDEVQLSIVDHGCGIAADAESRLFVPFESSKPDGMGIGLKICRSFVELHQGRLWFTRNPPPQGGCSFHLALRACSAPPGRAEGSETRERGEPA
ncbi:sensor histidine kinase [Rubrivivax gelatinosus]|nr:HAMP domain-containing sensor histidine kinase [Rubrivivax gelatinosus]